MKRVLFALVGTVAGIVALLSFKTQAPIATSGAALPAAALPGSSISPSPSGRGTTTTSAPPDPHGSSVGAGAAGYTGTAVSTRYGVVQVRITVAGTKITNVAFVQLTAFDGRSQRINSGAAPILLRETLNAQSARIDTVSGASYTSQGYEQSLQSALDQAGIR